MKRKLIALLLVFCVMVSIAPVALAGDVDYADVKKDSWYALYVDSISSRGYMSGTGNNMFSPDTTLSRAMFVTVLGRIHGASPEYYNEKPSAFSDVAAEQWYTPYVAWAAEAGITSGVGGGKFAPNDLVTREQMATFIYRYAQKYNIKLEETYFPAKSFSDDWNISDFAKDAVDLMRLTGIVTGTDRGEFLPKNGATRAEAATVFVRFIYAMPSDRDEAVEGVDYKVASSKATIVDDVDDYCWVHYIAEIENISTKNLYIETGIVDIDKENGNPLGTLYCHPGKAEVILPGEKAYLYASDLFEGVDVAQTLRGSLRASIYTARVKQIVLPVSNFSITDSPYGWMEFIGKVENSTTEKASICVDMVLKDERGEVVGIITDTIHDVAPGATVNFDGSSVLLPAEMTTKSISSCDVYAYPIQFQ